MFLAKKLISALVLPPTGLVLLALFGVWLARRHPRTGGGLTVVSLLTLLALSMPPVADGLVGNERQRPISDEELRGAEAIVVLGGGSYLRAPEYGRDTVGYYTLERVRYGVHLQRRTGLPILVAGGSPFGGRPEGESMKETIESDFGGSVRWVEALSRDTAENAQFSADRLKADGVKRIALVTHAAHMQRAALLFRAQGLDVMAAPTGFRTNDGISLDDALPSVGALAASSSALREGLGRFVARVTAR